MATTIMAASHITAASIMASEEEDNTLRSLRSEPWVESSQTSLIMVIAAASLFGLILLCTCVRWHRRTVDRDRQKKKTLAVFQYLRGMNVDDIDIRRSPAGGFHVSYLNDLAHGKNEWDEEDDSGTTSGSGSDGSHKGTKTEKTVSQVDDEEEEEKKGLLASA
jgi:hypothetical protein